MTNQHTMTRLASALPLLVLVVALFAIQVQAQGGSATIKNYCGVKACIEPLSMTCEEMIDRYEFQGSCCSLESVPQINGCRVTVSYGNCFWYPWCGDCDENDQKEISRCNNVFETDANVRPCPAGSFDPLAIQSDPEWSPPSCSPTMSPTDSFPPTVEGFGESSTDTTTSTTKRIATMIISILAFIATTA